jgi:sigma-B regulation protein RsbU (phosphoserine phosphatase)
MLRDLTRAEDTAAAYNTFISKYTKLKPVTHFVGVLPDASAPDAYRIMWCQPAGTPFDRTHVDQRRFASLPVHRGGFIGRMIADDHPKYAMDLSMQDDPVLRGMVGAASSCMVLPIFEGDKVGKWSFGFSCSELQDPREVSEAQLVTNMLGLVGRQLHAVNTAKQLNQQLRDQIDQIARVQQALLPSKTPDIPGLEVATSYLTSNETGGDYYDFIALPGGRWGILIADVSGHGAAAATVMAMLHAILHCYVPSGTADQQIDPAAVLEFANDRLIAAGLEGNFITAFFGVIDPTTGILRYSNAGHNPPRIKCGLTGRISAVDRATTLPLGILDQLNAVVEEVQLKPNDTLILYTDGITEAFSPGREQFGVERMDEALDACTGAPDCVVDSIHKSLFAHRTEATRDDDQTIVAIRYHGVCALPRV